VDLVETSSCRLHVQPADRFRSNRPPGQEKLVVRQPDPAGTARLDAGVAEVKALLVGCQAMQSYNAELAEKVTDIALDGLRAQAR
jgi:hypothetical protein